MNESEKAVEATRRDKSLTVGCPTCLAYPGQRCFEFFTGQPSNFVHKARVLRWRAVRS